MAVTQFIIEEILPFGTASGARAPVRIVWDATHHNAPVSPLEDAGEMRFKRTDYSGAVEPSMQMLGPKLTPVTFTGMWNDRHNAGSPIEPFGGEGQGGYAKRMKRAFKSLCYRGNPVRIMHDDYDVVAAITTWKFYEEKSWRIRYEFSIEALKDDLITSKEVVRSPQTVSTPRVLADEAQNSLSAVILAHQTAPQGVLTEDTYLLVGEDLDDLNASMVEVDDIVSQRVLVAGGDNNDLLRLANGFRSMRARALDVLDKLTGLRADIDMAYRTGARELEFELWVRGLAFNTRVLVGGLIGAERDSRARAQPHAIRLYQPHVGENLYAISNAVYGTPHNWAIIADRNDLQTFTVNTTQPLIIPEEPAA